MPVPQRIAPHPPPHLPRPEQRDTRFDLLKQHQREVADRRATLFRKSMVLRARAQRLVKKSNAIQTRRSREK